MEIKNFSWNENLSKRFNNPSFPKSIRGIIIGKSGCGKTTLLLNLLLKPGWLDYNKLYVFGRSLFQPEYRILKKGLEEKLSKEALMNLFDNRDEIISLGIPTSLIIEEMAKDLNTNDKTEKDDIECKFYEFPDDVPDPRDLNATHKNLMIFDDLLLEPQNKCETYYIRGRHSNVDCFYLSQNYFKLPRQTIRENANFICIFKQDNKNINHIYNDHVSSDMTKDEFRNLCKEAWKKPFGFVVIDLSSEINGGKYRSGLDTFYFPNLKFF